MTYDPKFLPTKQCQSPLYFLFNSSFKCVAIYCVVCILSKAYLAVANISAYISGAISLALTTGLFYLFYCIWIKDEWSNLDGLVNRKVIKYQI